MRWEIGRERFVVFASYFDYHLESDLPSAKTLRKESFANEMPFRLLSGHDDGDQCSSSPISNDSHSNDSNNSNRKRTIEIRCSVCNGEKGNYCLKDEEVCMQLYSLYSLVCLFCSPSRCFLMNCTITIAIMVMRSDLPYRYVQKRNCDGDEVTELIATDIQTIDIGDDLIVRRYFHYCFLLIVTIITVTIILLLLLLETINITFHHHMLAVIVINYQAAAAQTPTIRIKRQQKTTTTIFNIYNNNDNE